MIDPRATVIRDGRRSVISAENIVPGDLVLLEPGDRVPADLRLVRTRNLRIDEAVLTGESVPVDKGIEPVEPRCAAWRPQLDGLLRDVRRRRQRHRHRRDHRYAPPSSAASATLVGTVEALTTPLLRQMAVLARQTHLRDPGYRPGRVRLRRLRARLLRGPRPSWSWSASPSPPCPEGLPAVMTITLGNRRQRMAARHAIVRRLPAVETLGSVSVICSDKTGTLTRNEMTVRTRRHAPDKRVRGRGVGYRPEGGFEANGHLVEAADDATLPEAARAAILCNDAELAQAEGAWVVRWRSDGRRAWSASASRRGTTPAPYAGSFPRTDEIPFDTQHQFMATLHHSHDGGAFAYIKGAPEQRARDVRRPTRPRPATSRSIKDFWPVD